MNCCKCSGNGMVRGALRYERCERCNGDGYEPRIKWKRYVAAILAMLAFVCAVDGAIAAIVG